MITLWAVCKDSPSYFEEIISTACKTQSDIDKIIRMATIDGWHIFRVSVDNSDSSVINDFKNTVK